LKIGVSGRKSDAFPDRKKVEKFSNRKGKFRLKISGAAVPGCRPGGIAAGVLAGLRVRRARGRLEVGEDEWEPLGFGEVSQDFSHRVTS
jgi:hypothetical protein